MGYHACELCGGGGSTWRPHVTLGTLARWFWRLATNQYLPALTQTCTHCGGTGREPPPWGPTVLPPPPPPRRVA